MPGFLSRVAEDESAEELAIRALFEADTKKGKTAAVLGDVQKSWMDIYTTGRDSGLVVSDLLDRHLKPIGYQCHASSKLAYRDGKVFIFFTMPVEAIYDPYGGGGRTSADPDSPEFQKALHTGLAAAQSYLGVAPYPDREGHLTWKANVEVSPPGRHIKGAKTAKGNAKVVEVPANFHPVVLEEPKATRKEFPFEGFIDFQGIKIDVENAKGGTRSGTGPEGDWSIDMHAHYGEIRGTEGTDGDKLDVYVGENHDASLVVVIHQHNPWDGQYDEDKVVLGCDSIEEAIGLYKKQYDRPGFFKDKEFTAMPIGAFWRWVNEERNKGKRVKMGNVILGPEVTQAIRLGQSIEAAVVRVDTLPPALKALVSRIEKMMRASVTDLKLDPWTFPAQADDKMANPAYAAGRKTDLVGKKSLLAGKPHYLIWIKGDFNPKNEYGMWSEYLGYSVRLLASPDGEVLLDASNSMKPFHLELAVKEWSDVVHKSVMDELRYRQKIKLWEDGERAKAEDAHQEAEKARKDAEAQLDRFLTNPDKYIDLPAGTTVVQSPQIPKRLGVQLQFPGKLPIYIRVTQEHLSDGTVLTLAKDTAVYGGTKAPPAKTEFPSDKLRFRDIESYLGHLVLKYAERNLDAAAAAAPAPEENVLTDADRADIVTTARVTKGVNPFIEGRDFFWSIGFYKVTNTVYWTGSGFKNLASVRSDPEYFKTRAEAEHKVRTELLKFIKQWRPAEAHLVMGWDGTGAPAHVTPAIKAPAVPKAPTTPEPQGFQPGDVTRYLKSMSTKKGGRTLSVDFYPPGSWSVEPSNRQRLDHYVGRFYHPGPDEDPEGWDSDGWEEDYAGPLRDEVLRKLEGQFGKGVFYVDIGEKGHIDVQLTATGKGLMGKQARSKLADLIGDESAAMGTLLAFMRGMAWNYITSHWQVAGDSFYGDHLMFERLYKQADGEADGLAEKLVALYGKDAVDGLTQAQVMARTLTVVADIGCPFERGLHMERMFQHAIKEALKALEATGRLGIGMDDLLRTMAGAHDGNIYLLQQRMGGKKTASARRPQDAARKLAVRYAFHLKIESLAALR